jgi:hypothetical protein
MIQADITAVNGTLRIQTRDILVLRRGKRGKEHPNLSTTARENSNDDTCHLLASLRNATELANRLLMIGDSDAKVLGLAPMHAPKDGSAMTP